MKSKDLLVIFIYWLVNITISAYTTNYFLVHNFSYLQIGLMMSISVIYTLLIDKYFKNHDLYLKKSIISLYIIAILLMSIFMLRNKADVINMNIF